MVKLTLVDGTTKKLTEREARMINLMEALDGKAIINVEFFEELGK